jgi:hypothetical protein
MLKRIVTIILVLMVSFSIFSGCARTQKETMLDRNWGRSFESAKYNQILNPEAGKDLEPVVGLDGQAAEKNMEKYRKGFEKEPSEAANDSTLGVIGTVGRK